LFNAVSIETVDVLKYVIEKKKPKKIIVIPDTDKAGQEMLFRLEQNIDKL